MTNQTNGHNAQLAPEFREAVDRAFEPLREYLSMPDILEICINSPGSIFVEKAGVSGIMQRFDVPELTADRIRHMAERVAALTFQFVNEEEPLLSATLPDGSRVQVVLPPVTPNGGILVVRRKVVQHLSIADYANMGKLSQASIIDEFSELSNVELDLVELLRRGDFSAFLIKAVHSRVSMLVSGGTGSGKTTLLNALLSEIPHAERIVTIEDAIELVPPQPNHAQLVATRGDQNLANVDTRRLVEASLRLRPDRLLLGEIRGGEAFDFLQAINTGHPGSLSTIHANSPLDAYNRLALLILQNGIGGLSKPELVDDLKRIIPIVVQLGRTTAGPGSIREIYFEAYERHLKKTRRSFQRKGEGAGEQSLRIVKETPNV